MHIGPVLCGLASKCCMWDLYVLRTWIV